jgi:hypothetical protein
MVTAPSGRVGGQRDAHRGIGGAIVAGVGLTGTVQPGHGFTLGDVQVLSSPPGGRYPRAMAGPSGLRGKTPYESLLETPAQRQIRNTKGSV